MKIHFGYTDFSLPSKYLIVRFWNWLCYRCYYKHIWQFKLRESSKRSQKEYESTLEGLRNFNPCKQINEVPIFKNYQSSYGLTLEDLKK